MVEGDGIQQLEDGAVEDGGGQHPEFHPPLSDDVSGGMHLWVVREDDVVHAPEHCPFGIARPGAAVKHTNLTAGLPAYSGGELIISDDNVLMVSGNSGRYGPRSEEEMNDVVGAFRESGYVVYSPGYDHEAARAFPLVGPRLIKR